MLVVSLTGGIASGKSTASRLFAGAPHNVPLIDLDVLARQVVAPDDASHTLDKLVAHFGRQILQSDGTLDRPALGRLTFGKEKEAQRKVLNKYTHAAIRKRMAWLLAKYWVKGTSVVIVDTPLAVEAGLWKMCGEMILVYCPPETQLERMLKRDSDKGLTPDDAKNRLSSQFSIERKLPYADVVLDNADRASQSLEEQVGRVVQRWTSERSRGLGRVRTWLQWLVPPVGLLMAALAIWSRSSRVTKKLKKQNTADRSK